MESQEYHPRALTDDERRLLYRLKLSLWITLTLFFIHAMLAAWFPEIYPITRWAMFSEADRGYKELREGYFVYYELRVTDVNGGQHIITQDDYYRGLPISSLSVTAAAMTMNNAALTDSEDPDTLKVTAEAQTSLFERSEQFIGTPITQIEVWIKYFEINYEQYPYVRYDTPAHEEQVTVLQNPNLTEDTSRGES